MFGVLARGAVSATARRVVPQVARRRAPVAARRALAASASSQGHGGPVKNVSADDEAAAAVANAGSVSFIEAAKAKGVQALLGTFLNTGTRFDSNLSGMRVVKVGDGSVVCEVEVEERLQNAYKTLHGGAIATLVDIAGTIALLSLDPTKAGVSVDLNVSFCSAAKAGETVLVEGRVLRAGKKLGFTEVDIRLKSTGQLIASGRHTKAL